MSRIGGELCFAAFFFSVGLKIDLILY